MWKVILWRSVNGGAVTSISFETREAANEAVRKWKETSSTHNGFIIDDRTLDEAIRR